MAIRIADIQRAVAAEFALPKEVLLGQSHKRPIVRPRQIAMYLARKLTGCSLPQIGRAFGRDHSTVIHAIRAIEAILATSDKITDRVNRIQQNLAEDDIGRAFASRVEAVQSVAALQVPY